MVVELLFYFVVTVGSTVCLMRNVSDDGVHIVYTTEGYGIKLKRRRLKYIYLIISYLTNTDRKK